MITFTNGILCINGQRLEDIVKFLFSVRTPCLKGDYVSHVNIEYSPQNNSYSYVTLGPKKKSECDDSFQYRMDKTLIALENDKLNVKFIHDWQREVTHWMAQKF